MQFHNGALANGGSDGGEVKPPSTKVCPTCDGKGNYDCFLCLGTKLMPNITEPGKSPCIVCSATGKITCVQCKGVGTIPG